MAKLPVEPVEPSGSQDPAASGAGESSSSADLAKASENLKARIEEARHRNDMPVDSALGSPSFEKDAADGRYDVPESKDED